MRGRLLVAVMLVSCSAVAVYAQNSMPAPSGGHANEIQEVQPPVSVPAPQGANVRPPVSLLTGTPDELEKRGDELRDVKDHLQALDYYEAANRKKPTATVQNKIGMTYIAMGRLDKAKSALKRATKMDKQYAEAINNLGVVCYLMAMSPDKNGRPRRDSGKLNEAISDYRKAIMLKDDSASFHSNLAAALMDRRKEAEAMVEYHRAFELDPNVFERSSRMGVSAKMSSPEDRAKFSYILSKLYASNGDLDRALFYLRRAMEDGYPEINNVYKDSEFASLRSDERFTELMAARPTSIPQ
jgi:tetratricopeptide (TPR) repeat protein